MGSGKGRSNGKEEATEAPFPWFDLRSQLAYFCLWTFVM